MTGTLINVAAIIVGSLIGIFFGARLPEKLKETVVNGMGLFTAAIGLQMFFGTDQSLIVLGALIIARCWGNGGGLRMESPIWAFGCKKGSPALVARVGFPAALCEDFWLLLCSIAPGRLPSWVRFRMG